MNQSIDLEKIGVKPRTIRIKNLQVLRHGGSGSKSWILYEVEAEELDGTPITEPLRSFEPLEGEVEVAAEARLSKDGTTIESYTLKPIRSARRRDRASGAAPSDHEARIVSLEADVADLTRKMNALIKAFGEE